MTIDMDIGTAFGIATVLVGAWFGMAKLMFGQFERRQDERFAALTSTLEEQKADLDEHLRRQDVAAAEIRRVESTTLGEIRKVEADLRSCQLDSLQRFQTKIESTAQHAEILSAIRALSARIDQIHGVGVGIKGVQ